jgi:TPR repeat protein
LAESGDPIAQFALGAIYADNAQFTDHDSLAVQWYQRAALQGYARAQHRLAHHLISGRGIARDIDRGVALLDSAARQGKSDAQRLLGLLYLDGEYVEQDFDRAFALLEEAALNGDEGAVRRVGAAYGTIMIMQSFGAPIPTYTDPIPEDFEMFADMTYGRNSLQMMAWYRRMADAGYGWVHHNLGFFYQHGVNVPKDRERAAELYRKAIELGFDQAKEALDNLEAEDRMQADEDG